MGIIIVKVRLLNKIGRLKICLFSRDFTETQRIILILCKRYYGQDVIDMTVYEKKQNETARQYALRVLRNKILGLELKPGQLVSESEIAEQLGLSRTPVREAFKDLSAAAIVEIQPQKGTFVSLIDMEMVEEARFLRSALERVVVGLLCDNISEEDMNALEENVVLQELAASRKDSYRFFSLDNIFHERLFKSCSKGKVYDFIGGMMIHFNRVRVMNLTEMDVTGPLEEHKNILAAVREKDKPSAIAEMDKHLSRVNSDKIYLYDRHPEYFKNVEHNIGADGDLCLSALTAGNDARN